MNTKIPETREGLKDLMKHIAAEIGKMELQRRVGQYVSMREVDMKKKEFKRISSIYKSRYYSFL